MRPGVMINGSCLSLSLFFGQCLRRRRRWWRRCPSLSIWRSGGSSHQNWSNLFCCCSIFERVYSVYVASSLSLFLSVFLSLFTGNRINSYYIDSLLASKNSSLWSTYFLNSFFLKLKTVAWIKCVSSFYMFIAAIFMICKSIGNDSLENILLGLIKMRFLVFFSEWVSGGLPARLWRIVKRV